MQKSRLTWFARIHRSSRPFMTAVLTAAVLTLALTLASCATRQSTAARSPEARPQDMTIDELWSSIRADLIRGNDGTLDARASRLAVLQADRCQRLRATLSAEGTESPNADMTELARCEAALREYRTIARISDYPSSRSRH